LFGRSKPGRPRGRASADSRIPEDRGEKSGKVMHAANIKPEQDRSPVGRAADTLRCIIFSGREAELGH